MLNYLNTFDFGNHNKENFINRIFRFTYSSLIDLICPKIQGLQIHLHYHCPQHQCSVRQQAGNVCFPARLTAIRSHRFFVLRFDAARRSFPPSHCSDFNWQHVNWVMTKHLLTVRAWTSGQHPTALDRCMTQSKQPVSSLTDGTSAPTRSWLSGVSARTADCRTDVF